MPKDTVWVDFLRMQHPVGSRIIVSEYKSTPEAIAPGTAGKLQYIDDDCIFHIVGEDGKEFRLNPQLDRFKVRPPELHTEKLYMPLNAEFIAYNEWGDLDEEDDGSGQLDGRDLVQYKDRIAEALLKERMPEEAERGIMNWYHEDDSVNDKVRSVVFESELRDGQLWGVAVCRIAGELTPDEMETLKEYISGQASDGWGEGFEQREIEVDNGELYVSLWSPRNWEIKTEKERFAPKLADGLPEICFSTLKSTGELICIKRGESGYYPSVWSTSDRAENERLAEIDNLKLGVTNAQRQAMEAGSMFGWGVPAANPKFYTQKQPEMGGMTLG